MTKQEKTPEYILNIVRNYKENVLTYVGIHRLYEDWNLLDKCIDELDAECLERLSGGITVSDLMSYDHDTLVNYFGLKLRYNKETATENICIYSLPVWLLPILNRNSDVYYVFDFINENGTIVKTKPNPIVLYSADMSVSNGYIDYGFLKSYPK